MTRVVLQPAGDRVGKKNYTNTITRLIPLNRIEKFVTDSRTEYLKNIYSGGSVPVWGATRGDKDRNKKQWEKMQTGDIVLFSGNNTIFSSGTVTLKMHNIDLAEELWGWKEPGVTWECIYFLDEVKQHDIHITEFNQLLGYTLTNPIRGFRVMDEEKSLKVLEYFNFTSDKYFEDVTKDDYKKLVEQFIEYDSLDIERIGKLRKEQAFLRKFLFGDRRTELCGICHKEFPVELLVTAHIKKRAECTREEKLDYKNIVMPMCTFGCDHLYEKGYIGVEKGVVCLLKNEDDLTSDLKKYIGNLTGYKCDFWSDQTKSYFVWHARHHSSK